jgi:hypothetical protein
MEYGNPTDLKTAFEIKYIGHFSVLDLVLHCRTGTELWLAGIRVLTCYYNFILECIMKTSNGIGFVFI